MASPLGAPCSQKPWPLCEGPTGAGAEAVAHHGGPAEASPPSLLIHTDSKSRHLSGSEKAAWRGELVRQLVEEGEIFAIWPFFKTISTIRPLVKPFLKIDRFSAFSYSTPWYVARRRMTQRRGGATSSTTMVVENTWPAHGVK